VSVQQVSTKDVGKKNKNEDAIALEEEVREVFIVYMLVVLVVELFIPIV
jgi:hypothetical protein